MSKTTQSSGEQAYQTLLGEIRMGVFSPGDRLREEDVSKRLALSRTPVREALRRLESDGIIEHRPRVGAIVRSLTHTEVVELYEMRIVLERTAAEMAAQHGAEAEFDALDAMNDKFEAERKTPAVGVAINQDFHRGLYLAGRNRFLLASARALNNSLLLVGPTTFTDPHRIDEVVQQHREITSALRRRDAKASAAAAEAHLQASLRYRLQNGGS